MARKLYVGNLPYEVGEAELQQLFEAAGTVETVNVSGRQVGTSSHVSGIDTRASGVARTE